MSIDRFWGSASNEVQVLQASRRRSQPAAGAVTVAVSLYNYDSYIGECLDSVAKQTHEPLELVVVDDASGDGSIDAVADWLDRQGARSTGPY